MKARLSRDTRVDCLRSLELFADCSKKELREVSALTTELDIGAGRVLVDADGRDRQVFVIVEGSAEVRDGLHLLARLERGAVLGGLARLPASATVCAATQMRVLVLADCEFRSLPERVRAEANRLMAGPMPRQAASGDVRDAGDECLDAPDAPSTSTRSALRGVGLALTLSLGLVVAGCHSGGRASSPHGDRVSVPPTTTSSPSTQASVPIPTTAATPSTTAAPAPRAPSAGEIAVVMRRTVEINLPDEYFTPVAEPATIADGRGGLFTAVIGLRTPHADGYGQLVFFWHDDRFLGWDSVNESSQINAIRPAGSGRVRVEYAHYSTTDALCCPSLTPVRIGYRWDGDRLVAEGTPPDRRVAPDVKLVAQPPPLQPD